MKRREIIPIIKRTTRPEMARMAAFEAFCTAEPLISLDWASFKRVWPMVHPNPKTEQAPKRLGHFLACSKCEGLGVLNHFKHYKGGVCFDCGGRGKHKVSKSTFETFKKHSEPKIRALASTMELK